MMAAGACEFNAFTRRRAIRLSGRRMNFEQGSRHVSPALCVYIRLYGTHPQQDSTPGLKNENFR
jgi:hypothetical protein